MRPDAIARRYARALFSIAKAQGSLDSVGSALGTMTDALVEPNVMRVLTGPVHRDRKRALLAKIVETVDAPQALRDFLSLLADHERLRHVEAIRTVFDALLDRERGITRAVICSATPLSADILEEITRTFGTITGRTVKARVEVVQDLIAGVIVEVEGKVYDGSLRTELGKLRQQMATGS
ncbi:MAG: ATP synthase F1 subunit delta [Deltaproteobacteria bacterium]|nr:ATP synthase F1 subunit delta [Deltaproteobacteria bacterium]